jgi:hypothetical protein
MNVREVICLARSGLSPREPEFEGQRDQTANSLQRNMAARIMCGIFWNAVYHVLIGISLMVQLPSTSLKGI